MSIKLEQVSLRLEPELRKKLQDEATRDDRPLAQLIKHILRNAVETCPSPKPGADAVQS